MYGCATPYTFYGIKMIAGTQAAPGFDLIWASCEYLTISMLLVRASFGHNEVVCDEKTSRQ